MSGLRTCTSLLILIAIVAAPATPLAGQAPATRPAGRLDRGLPDRPDYFPIAVWLQSPANAAKYKALGVNLYIGLWRGPTEEQLDLLEKVDMPVICEPNEYALTQKHRRIIVGWMHGDEPDNAQSLGDGKGWGPPIAPGRIIEDYHRIRRLDPSRPVFLNLGQGVAWDGWYGRGVRTRHPEDYAEYAKGGDILSFDIYPVTHDRKEVTGHIWYVGHGVQRLRAWSGGSKPVWACIETTHIGNPQVRPTPKQVRSIVWMALIHGANGLLYFAHEFQPRFVEAGLLAHPDIAKAVTGINRQVQALAPVLNSPTRPKLAGVSSSDQAVPIDILCKRHAGADYVFAIPMWAGQTRGRFTVSGLSGEADVEVLGEGRTIRAKDGQWEDDFEEYDAHLYRMARPENLPR